MTLFEKLMQASGLSPLFARASLTRALARADAYPDKLSTDQLRAALPEVEKVLKVFLHGDEVGKRLQDIKALTR
jgi:hypothetical protein